MADGVKKIVEGQGETPLYIRPQRKIPPLLYEIAQPCRSTLGPAFISAVRIGEMRKINEDFLSVPGHFRPH